MSKRVNQKYQAKSLKTTVVNQTAEIDSKNGISVKSIQLLFIFCLAFFLYSNSIGFDYTLDDAIVITENKFTKKGTDGIKDILTKDTFFGFFGENKQLVSGGRYRPLSLVTFAVEYEFFGQSPAVSHFINILMYASTGLLLLLLLYLLFPAASLSFFNIPFLATVLFIAHPLHTEAVANIKGRDEIMCFLGLVAMLYFLFRFVNKGGFVNLLLSLIIYFLALMSKENGITFLALVPLFLYFFSKKNSKQILLLSTLYLIPAILFWVLRSHFTKSSVTMEVTEVLNNPFVYMTAIQKYATVVYTWGRYFLLLVFPHPLTHDYYYNQITPKAFSDLSVIFILLLHAVLGWLAIKGLKNKSVIAFSIFFYFITFSVVSNLFFPIGTFMSERFVYISSFGFTLAGAWLLVKYLSKHAEPGKILDIASPANRAILIISVLIVSGYSFKTITRNEAWQDNFTLFLTDIETSPNSAKLRNSVGGDLMAAADKEEDPVKKKELLKRSIENLNKALEIYPRYVGAWLLLGNAYFKLDAQYDKAIDCYNKIISINPDYPDAYLNLGIVYKQVGRLNESTKNLLKYLAYKPENVNAYHLIGQNSRLNNKADSAIAFFAKVAELKPDFPDIYREIGSIYGQMKNDLNGAEVYLKKAVEQNPKDKTALENLGIVYGMRKDYDNALIILKRAHELDPRNINVLRNIGVTYLQKGDKENAGKYFAMVDQINSGK